MSEIEIFSYRQLVGGCLDNLQIALREGLNGLIKATNNPELTETKSTKQPQLNITNVLLIDFSLKNIPIHTSIVRKMGSIDIIELLRLKLQGFCR